MSSKSMIIILLGLYKLHMIMIILCMAVARGENGDPPPFTEFRKYDRLYLDY